MIDGIVSALPLAAVALAALLALWAWLGGDDD